MDNPNNVCPPPSPPSRQRIGTSMWTMDTDFHAKSVLYAPWKYYGDETEDKLIADLQLLRLVSNNTSNKSISFDHEQHIRRWVHKHRHQQFRFLVEHGPISLLLGILVKYHASSQLILDLLRYDPRVLYAVPENPKKLSLFGFALYIDADPDLIQSMMEVVGPVVSSNEQEEQQQQQLMRSIRYTVSWNRVSLRATIMLCRDEVREYINNRIQSIHDETPAGFDSLDGTQDRPPCSRHDLLLSYLMAKPSNLSKIQIILKCWKRHTLRIQRQHQSPERHRTLHSRQDLLWICTNFWESVMSESDHGSLVSSSSLNSIYIILRHDPTTIISQHKLDTTSSKSLLGNPMYKQICNLQLQRERLRQYQRNRLAAVDHRIQSSMAMISSSTSS